MNQKVALTIAGSDSCAGAGIQADIKTFLQHGIHGLSAVTSIVAETPHEVREVLPTPIQLLQSQINILLKTYSVDAIKIGLLPTRASVIAVEEILKNIDTTPIVIDPVMIASAGTTLSEDSAATALCERLLHFATVITPNLPEASTILGESITKGDQIDEAAQKISEKYSTACLLKGGHLSATDELFDTLFEKGKIHHFQHQKADTPESGIHGTGCTLSAAITANIANGKSITEAAKKAISYTQELIHEPRIHDFNDTRTSILGW